MVPCQRRRRARLYFAAFIEPGHVAVSIAIAASICTPLIPGRLSAEMMHDRSCAKPCPIHINMLNPMYAADPGSAYPVLYRQSFGFCCLHYDFADSRFLTVTAD